MASHRSLQLDFLRGIAILLVLGWHDPLPVPGFWLTRALEWPGNAFGWTGVDLFFVLSGFLVGGLLLKEYKQNGAIDAKRFLVRRAYKIWPQYYVFILIAGGLNAVIDKDWSWWPNLLHVQNYLGSPMMQTWSLAVEEHFYLALAFAFAFFAARKSDLAPLVRGIVALAAGVLLLRIGLAYNGVRVAHLLMWTHTRVDSLAVGVLIAVLYHGRHAAFERISRQRAPLAIASAVGPAFVVLVPKGSPEMAGPGLFVICLSCAAFLIYVFTAKLGEGVVGKALDSGVSRAVAWIGVHSYGIYLWHIVFGVRPTAFIFRKLGSGEVAWIVGAVAWYGLSIFGGVLMTKAVEIPMLKIRDRRVPAAVAGTSVEPVAGASEEPPREPASDGREPTRV